MWLAGGVRCGSKGADAFFIGYPRGGKEAEGSGGDGGEESAPPAARGGGGGCWCCVRRARVRWLGGVCGCLCCASEGKR